MHDPDAIAFASALVGALSQGMHVDVRADSEESFPAVVHEEEVEPIFGRWDGVQA